MLIGKIANLRTSTRTPSLLCAHPHAPLHLLRTPPRTASLTAHTNLYRFTCCEHQHTPRHFSTHTNTHRCNCCAHQHAPLHFLRTPTRTDSLDAHTNTHHLTFCAHQLTPLHRRARAPETPTRHRHIAIFPGSRLQACHARLLEGVARFGSVTRDAGELLEKSNQLEFLQTLIFHTISFRRSNPSIRSSMVWFRAQCHTQGLGLGFGGSVWVWD